MSASIIWTVSTFTASLLHTSFDPPPYLRPAGLAVHGVQHAEQGVQQ